MILDDLAPDKQVALVLLVIEIFMALPVGGERVIFRVALLLRAGSNSGAEKLDAGAQLLPEGE